MIAQAFAKRPAFIAYLTLGDGGLDYSLASALALVQGGVDILEIGLPFSDPIADGPVIQRAMQRSLQQGTKASDLIPFLCQLRKHTDVPLVIFSYYNPILSLGNAFLKEASAEGANGMLIVDLPFERMPISELDPILVVSTSTPQKRVQKIAEAGRGFIYYACQKGTTGMREGLPEHVADDIARIKKSCSLPVVIGFGISNKQSAAQALGLYPNLTGSGIADGFVVGSYFVDAMARRVSPQILTDLAKQIDPRSPL
jgi:tryptophan synthase alpha chain